MVDSPQLQHSRSTSTQQIIHIRRARLPFAGHATPLTYHVRCDGKQYVVIGAGDHTVSEPGDAIVAFALPGS